MGKKYKVEGRVTLYVDTWFEDDEKIDLKDQAYDAIRDLVVSVEAVSSGCGDDVTIGDIEIDGMEEQP